MFHSGCELKTERADNPVPRGGHPTAKCSLSGGQDSRVSASPASRYRLSMAVSFGAMRTSPVAVNLYSAYGGRDQNYGLSMCHEDGMARASYGTGCCTEYNALSNVCWSAHCCGSPIGGSGRALSGSSRFTSRTRVVTAFTLAGSGAARVLTADPERKTRLQSERFRPRKGQAG